MWLSRENFQIRPSHFDLSDDHNLIRIVSGLFMFSYVAGKFAGGGLSAATLGLFAKAGFQYPVFWGLVALGIALIEFRRRGDAPAASPLRGLRTTA